ncbi:MAG: 3-oxoacyl-ACP synthase [Armatimonadetes bacterium]|nr:3-oxoacyl-ACP synthase [Armatimonadota bacterium]
MSADVSIAGISTYFPAGYQTSREIAEATGIPQEIIEQRFGLRGKHIAAADEHVSDMAVKAARPLLDGFDPSEIDAVVYFGSAHKDYYLWTCAPKVQYQLGLGHAFTVEMMATSGCGPVALKVTRDMLLADASLRAILLVGACRESYIINYQNQRSRFAFNFADGAAAVLLRQGDDGHRVLASAIITDGSFAEDVSIPAGGSVHPASAQTIEHRMHFLDVPNPQRMKDRLDPISMDRFLEVIRRAVERSGFTLADIDFLAPLHTKRSLFLALLERLGLTEAQSFYLEEFGHMSAIDPFVVLSEAERRGRLRAGDLVVALSAGTGYTWAATAIQW